MRVFIEHSGNFQIKKTPNGRLLYKVEKNNNLFWIPFSNLVKEISLGNVENAKVVKNKIVFVKSDYHIEKMDNKNIIKLQKHLRALIEEYEQEQGFNPYDYADYEVIDFEERLSKIKTKDYKNYIIGYKGNKIENVFIISKETFGIPFVYNLYYEDYSLILNYCHIISDMIKNSVFCFDYLPDGNLNGFKLLNLDSNFKKGYTYMLSSSAYITKYNNYIVRNKIEDKYFPKLLDIQQVVVKRLKTADIMEYLSKYNIGAFEGVWGSDCNIYSVAGFQYFSYSDVFSGEINKDYLVAIYKGQIIGVIKYGLWDGHQSVPYIDVLISCRNNGIATLLIKELDKHLYSDYELHLTDESELGHKCGMAKLFKKYIKSTVVKDYEDLRGFR